MAESLSQNTSSNGESIALDMESYTRSQFKYGDEEGVARVLVIYSGGTIGMVNEGDGYAPRRNCMVSKLKSLPMFHWKERLDLLGPDEQNFLVLHIGSMTNFEDRPNVKDKNYVIYNVIEFDPLLDSSNMVIDDWIKMGKCIQDNYDAYDGFVVLHGTDTMAYTASALSFMCENLGKPIILTGSQIPIYETRSDGRDNFLASLIIAGTYDIPEVLLCFNDKVFRGNRCIKSDSGSFSAFSSPNMEPLVKLEIDIKVDWPAVFRSGTADKFVLQTNMCHNVGLLRLFPGITSQTVRAFLQPPVQGVVLQTYGAGNAPNNRPDILALFKEACQWGVLIINITQCSRGNVAASYATGLALREAGVIFGSDMTPEAALTKLSYVLGKHDWGPDTKKQMLARNLRGELSPVVSEQKISITDTDLIRGLAQHMNLSTAAEVAKVKEAIYPCIACAAAANNDIPNLESLRTSGGDLGMGNQDGRTPLHVASRNGHLSVVEYLIGKGVSVHKKDYRGDTPLIDAVEGNHPDIIRVLVRVGAAIPLRKGIVASKMCSAAAKNDVTALNNWLLAGAKPDWTDYDDRTPLHVAVTLRKREATKLLIQKGASVNLADAFGNTPRSMAAKLEFAMDLFNRKSEMEESISNSLSSLVTN